MAKDERPVPKKAQPNVSATTLGFTAEADANEALKKKTGTTEIHPKTRGSQWKKN